MQGVEPGELPANGAAAAANGGHRTGDSAACGRARRGAGWNLTNLTYGYKTQSSRRSAGRGGNAAARPGQARGMGGRAVSMHDARLEQLAATEGDNGQSRRKPHGGADGRVHKRLPAGAE